MTLNESFDCFKLSRKLAGLSVKTLYCYDSFVSPFLHIYGVLSLEEFSYSHIMKYIESVIDRDISRSSKSTYIRHFKVFVRWINDEYSLCLPVNKIRVPKTTKKVLRIYNDKEVRQIFNSVLPKSGWLHSRNQLVIAFMLDSGLRQNEICTLKFDDIILSDNIVRVHGKGDKERIVPLGRFVKRFYNEYINVCPFKSDYLFVSNRGVQLTCDCVKHMVYRISHSLPFEFSSHKLRHNFATNYCIDMYESRGQIDIYQLMVLMGHDEIKTTRRYLHFAQQIIATKSDISHLDKVYNFRVG